MAKIPCIDPTTTSAWSTLSALSTSIGKQTIRELCADNRSYLRHEAAGINADFSRQRLNQSVIEALIDLAEATGVRDLRDMMRDGIHINTTEDRAVLHMALRGSEGSAWPVDGSNASLQVHQVLHSMELFADAVRSGSWRGATGERIRDVVNIGIGGSDLGPAMAYEALRPFTDPQIHMHFVSNVDPSDILEVLSRTDPASTLFIVASKTFTTLETMSNAHAARSWLMKALGDAAVKHHFVAVSTNAEKVGEFGIDTTNMFGFWDWVGGRYSMDSAIGLSTMIAIGPRGFEDMLAGFRSMDEHFLTAEPAENVPLLMGLIGVWNRNFLSIPTTAVLPYSQYLKRFPAYLQQLTMESNGKSVRRDGSAVSYETGGIYWGEPGTNGQHSFYQLLHQGTSTVASDIIVVSQAEADVNAQQDMLVANALAQASVLSMGRTEAEVAAAGTEAQLIAHKVMPGNRPVNVLMTQRLNPFTLGALVALYEHSVFVQGAVWGINSFDQWGVELGKGVALGILQDIKEGTADDPGLDPPTRASLAEYLRLRQ
jgi:glucose-6-phosphate isomerase